MTSDVSRIMVLFLIIGGLMLTACSGMGESMERMGKKAHRESVIFDTRMAGYFNAKEVDAPTMLKPVDTAHCYKTLGEIECYDHPIAGDDSRVAGRQVPYYPSATTPAPHKAATVVTDTTSVQGRVETVARPVSVEVHEIGKTGKPQPLLPVK